MMRPSSRAFSAISWIGIDEVLVKTHGWRGLSDAVFANSFSLRSRFSGAASKMMFASAAASSIVVGRTMSRTSVTYWRTMSALSMRSARSA